LPAQIHEGISVTGNLDFNSLNRTTHVVNLTDSVMYTQKPIYSLGNTCSQVTSSPITSRTYPLSATTEVTKPITSNLQQSLWPHGPYLSQDKIPTSKSQSQLPGKTEHQLSFHSDLSKKAQTAKLNTDRQATSSPYASPLPAHANKQPSLVQLIPSDDQEQGMCNTVPFSLTPCDLSMKSRPNPPSNDHSDDMPLDLTAPKDLSAPKQNLTISAQSSGKQFLNPSPTQSPFSHLAQPMPNTVPTQCNNQLVETRTRPVSVTLPSDNSGRLSGSGQTLNSSTARNSPYQKHTAVSPRSVHPPQLLEFIKEQQKLRNDTVSRTKINNEILPQDTQTQVASYEKPLNVNKVGDELSAKNSKQINNAFSKHSSPVSRQSADRYRQIQPSRCLEKLIASEVRKPEDFEPNLAKPPSRDNTKKKAVSNLGLPVQDFFNKTTLDNTYSSMLLANRASGNISTGPAAIEPASGSNHTETKSKCTYQHNTTSGVSEEQYFSNQILSSIFAQNALDKQPVNTQIEQSQHAVIKTEMSNETETHNMKYSEKKEPRQEMGKTYQAEKYQGNNLHQERYRSPTANTMRLPIVSPVLSMDNVKLNPTDTLYRKRTPMSDTTTSSKHMHLVAEQNSSVISQRGVSNNQLSHQVSSIKDKNASVNPFHQRNVMSSTPMSSHQNSFSVGITNDRVCPPMSTSRGDSCTNVSTPLRTTSSMTPSTSVCAPQLSSLTSTTHHNLFPSSPLVCASIVPYSAQSYQALSNFSPQMNSSEFAHPAISQPQNDTLHLTQSSNYTLHNKPGHSYISPYTNKSTESVEEKQHENNFQSFPPNSVNPHLLIDQGINSNALKLMQFRAPGPKKYSFHPYVPKL